MPSSVAISSSGAVGVQVPADPRSSAARPARSAVRKHVVDRRRQQRAHFGRIPDVELAFVALRVRIERRPVAAARRLHVAHDPVGSFGRDARNSVVAGRERRVRVDAQQLAVVVQHLLEVRDHPVLVDASSARNRRRAGRRCRLRPCASASASPCTANAGRARRSPPSRAIDAAGTRCSSDAGTSAPRRSRRIARSNSSGQPLARGRERRERQRRVARVRRAATSRANACCRASLCCAMSSRCVR